MTFIIGLIIVGGAGFLWGLTVQYWTDKDKIEDLEKDLDLKRFQVAVFENEIESKRIQIAEYINLATKFKAERDALAAAAQGQKGE